MKQIGVNKFIFALAAVLYIAKHVTIQIFRARTTSNSQTHKHTQRDFTLVPLTRALALVYYYIHKVYTRKKKYRLTACIHQSVKKQNAQHTGIDIFQFMMLALWTVVSKQFFCPLYWALISTRTDNMAYLLVAFGQFAHRKITAKIMCTVQLLQHLILRCARRMCTAHNNYVQVMHMTYSQAGCFIKRR